MHAPSNVLGLGPEPQSGEPKLYGKGPNASLEQEALDYSATNMKQSQKQIHKKNSLSQGLVIQRKKRLINTLSTTANPGIMPNSQSYQLSGKQIPSK